MAEDEEVTWNSEAVPDQDLLFMRIHRVWIRNGELIPGVFQNRDAGMSTDWNKYSTPEETLKRANDPSMNGVIQFVVEDVRGIPQQRVVHTPNRERNNRAHTDVFGEKDTEARLKFKRISSWIIPFTNPGS